MSTAQLIFAAGYLVSAGLSLALYAKARVTPPWVAALSLASRRLHSIWALRLFNDGPATLLAQGAFLAWTSGQDWLAAILYSLGVGMKMNILLYAPALLMVMLWQRGITRTVLLLAVCAVVQLALGAPFLLAHPVSYLTKAFELSRVFTYRWTVNWAFLPESVFVSKPLAAALLGGHVTCLGLLAWKWWAAAPAATTPWTSRPQAAWALTCLWTANFIGVAWARTLHYQFLAWYVQALPAVSWLASGGSTVMTLATFFAVEFGFNVFPATAVSSGVLQAAHALLLLGILSLSSERLAALWAPSPRAAAAGTPSSKKHA